MKPEEDFAGWLPVRIWQPGDEWHVDWCWFGKQRLTRPFFRDDVEQALRLPFNQALRRETKLQALLDWQTACPGLRPSAFIFHASRCGSTLMAQMLASLNSHVVLSEPPPLDSLLRAHRIDPGIAPRQADLVSALLSAFGQRRQGEEQRLVVKLDAWNVFEASLLRTLYPQTPRLFLYRDPLEIAVSQLRQPGLQRVPGMLGPTELDARADDADDLSVVDYTCRMVGRLLTGGLELCLQHGGTPVNYCELPEALWTRLASALGVRDVDRQRLESVAIFDAKQPSMTFSSDTLGKRDSAGEELRQAIERWAREPYERLESIRLSKSPRGHTPV